MKERYWKDAPEEDHYYVTRKRELSLWCLEFTYDEICRYEHDYKLSEKKVRLPGGHKVWGFEKIDLDDEGYLITR